MARVVLISRLALAVALVLVAIYYAFRSEIRPSLSFKIRLGVHLLLVAACAALVAAPVVEFRATQIYSLVNSDVQQQARLDPIKQIFRMPRLVGVVPALCLLATGTLWGALVRDEKVTYIPGILAGVGAVMLFPMTLWL
jgi:hypothetical protein